METQELNIEIPKGYIIDIENSDLTKGIVKFKKEDTKPRSWEEFCKSYPVKKGEACITIIAEIGQVRICKEDRKCPNYCIAEEEAEAFLALMQLRQLRKAWVEDWEPKALTRFWGILYNFEYNTFETASFSTIGKVMNFPTRGMAEDFIECFKDLLEKAKILL